METASEMERRHAQERAELQTNLSLKRIELASMSSRTKRVQAMKEIEKLDREVKARHLKESKTHGQAVGLEEVNAGLDERDAVAAAIAESSPEDSKSLLPASSSDLSYKSDTTEASHGIKIKPKKGGGRHGSSGLQMHAHHAPVPEEAIDPFEDEESQESRSNGMSGLLDSMKSHLHIGHHRKSTGSSSDGVSDAPRRDESTDHTSASAPPAPPSHTPRRNRQKERASRKAAAAENERQEALREAREMPDEAEGERLEIDTKCKAMGVELCEVRPDGHCMYSAFADQLNILRPRQGKGNYDYHILRREAAEYMRCHPDDFMPFLTDSHGVVMTREKYDDYLERVAGTSHHDVLWGGQIELNALSHAFKIPVHVLQAGSDIIKVGDEAEERHWQKGDEVVLLSYHKKMYGLGQHYNSLRPLAH